MLETKITTTSLTFSRIEIGASSSIVGHKLITRPDGKQKHISVSIPIRDERLLARAEGELHRGDAIVITVETRWAEAGIPTTALDFARVSEPSMMENWPISGRSETVYVEPIPEKQSRAATTKGKSQ